MPDHALLLTNGPRSTDSVPCLHTMATSRANSTTTTKLFITTGITEQGDQLNPRLPQGVQLRPGEHTGKIRSPKDKSLSHVGDSGDSVQIKIRRNAYYSLPQKTHKLQARSSSALFSKLRELDSSHKPSGGTREDKPCGQGEGNQEKSPISEHVTDELHNMECEGSQQC